MAGVRHGTVLHIAELMSRGDAATGMSVRVLGALEEQNIGAATLRITHASHSLVVDTSALGGIASLQRGALLQFIGEVATDPLLVVRARVMIRVDGLNLNLFDKALHEQRAFLAAMPGVASIE